MAQKRSALTIKICDLPGSEGLILKEEALSRGAECALPAGVVVSPAGKFSALLLCTHYQLAALCRKLATQSFSGLRALAVTLRQFLKEPDPKAPQLMGIINVTPDSFFDGGRFNSAEQALQQAKTLAKQGCKLIDIGGESTRPGASEISVKEELHRVVPAVKLIRQSFPKLTISVDTTKYQVAEAVLAAGANIINDVSGLTRSPKIAKVVAAHRGGLIIMHRSANSQRMQQQTNYADIVTDIYRFLERQTTLAVKAGVSAQKIIVDPGIGFGKTTADNLYLIKQLAAFRSLGYQLLLGASRKSVIGETLKLPPPERLSGTLATSLAGQLGFADYLRVHDIKENLQATKLLKAIIQANG